jgi:hypothetical protein
MSDIPNFNGTLLKFVGWDIVVDIETRYGLKSLVIEFRSRAEIFRTRPDRPWDSSSFLYNEYPVYLPALKRPGCGFDHPPQSSAEVEKKLSYNSTPRLGLGWTLLEFVEL